MFESELMLNMGAWNKPVHEFSGWYSAPLHWLQNVDVLLDLGLGCIYPVGGLRCIGPPNARLSRSVHRVPGDVGKV